MKVVLAAQVLSRSTADALRYLRDDLRIAAFAGSEATEEYCRKFNTLFDILNSWNPKAIGDRAPLSLQNIEEKESTLNDLEDFVKSLRFTCGKFVGVTKRKTCILGFVATIRSTIALTWELLTQTNPLDYVCTRLTQQDP